MTVNNAGALLRALAPILERVRRDVCWKKTNDGPRRVDAELTDARMLLHLTGGAAYGAAPIRPGESTTRVAVLDFDSHKGDTPWTDMQAVVARVAAVLEGQGGAPVVFRSSGGHGMHLYCLWETPQDAYSVRQWLRAALAAADLKPGAGGVAKGEVEAFPKQDGVAEGKFGNMFILPLAGRSVLLDPFDLDDLPPDYLIGMTWPMSSPVPVLEKPERTAVAVPADDAELAQLASALAGIPNEGEQELDYDDWRDVVFGIHHATTGSDYGLQLAHDFSARSSKYDPDFLDNRVWPYIDSTREDAITVRSILHRAREAGWAPPSALAEQDFEVVTPPKDEKGKPLPKRPNYERDKQGCILPTISNVVLALRAPYECMEHVAYDTFKDEVVLARLGTTGWRPMTDADMVRLRIQLEGLGFKPIGRELIRDGVSLVADENRIDTAQLWLDMLDWDGVPRIEQFCVRYLGAADTPYTRALGLYLWTALAGRVLEPGCKADGVPILEGAQGLGKSSAVAALVPAPEFYTEVSFNEKTEDLARKMRGTLVAEIGELSGLHTRELEAIKAFVSRTHETWTPKYKEFKTTFARRLLFIGTTNQQEILADSSGNRRWLPVHVTAVDIEALRADREQLWAEARERFLADGVAYDAVVGLAGDAHEAYRRVDDWEGIVSAWLEEFPDFDESSTSKGARWQDVFTTAMVAQGALHLTPRDLTWAVSKRLCEILRKFGFEAKTVKVQKKAVWGWRAGPACKFLQVGDDLV